MYSISRPISRAGLCLGVSAVFHLAALHSSGFFSVYDFRLPVTAADSVMLDMRDSSPRKPVGASVTPAVKQVKTYTPAVSSPPLEMPQESTARILSDNKPSAQAVDAPASAVSVPPASSPLPVTGSLVDLPYEKLTYRLSLLGVPVGSAELEARSDNGETVITLRIHSNSTISGIYPVNDFIESRHVNGRFIMVKIDQEEGDFRNNESITINLPKKRVTWQNNRDGRHGRVTIPDGIPLDSLSGIYFLRTRRLPIGAIDELKIFDGGVLVDLPIAVLGREELLLPNLSRVTALAMCLQPKTAGMFRQTGEVLIWMTDDERRVPVRIVASIPLGTVTAELVSAESQQVE